MAQLPVLFIAFANEQEDRSRYLRNLPKEMKLIRNVLEAAEKEGLCELVVRPNAGVKDIIDTFQNEHYRDRIALFHYGGHADGYQLLLEDIEGSNTIAHGAGLVSFLSAQESLQLVFLNGCSTQRQAEELIQQGVSAVIGTAQEIADGVATQLAIRFYQGLANGISIRRAWKEAVDEQKIYLGTNTSRSIVLEDKGQIDRFPWEFLVRDGSEIVNDWNLPEASQNPLFGLPKPAPIDLPSKPYRFLDRYHASHRDIFFGRSYYIRDLFRRATDALSAPVILLYGKSGVGKSSLIEAGLFPRLEVVADVIYIRKETTPQGLSAALEQHLKSSSNDLDLTALNELKEEIKRLEQFARNSLDNLQSDINILIRQLKNKLKSQSASKKANSMLESWIEQERIRQRPLTIVLDQVEEVFNRPTGEGLQELHHLFATIHAIFNDPNHRPKGKLILSYRKEYHSEILEACRQFRLPKEECYIQSLKRKDIIEIIRGLTSSTRLKNAYRLEIEENLPSIIADDLLVDNDSAHAPVLQILMTKMWSQVEQDETRYFSIKNYQKLLKDGILLEDFLQQQLEKIRQWNQKTEQSGLVLDILNHHTTENQVANYHHIDDLRKRYEHQEEILEKILIKCKELSLLSNIGKNRTQLAHDTLAPVVYRAFKDSNYPGQRATRILDNKIRNYHYNPDTYIDIDDLEVVESGREGMRFWVKKEQELIDKSRERRKKLLAERKRNARFRRIALTLLLAFALVISLLWIKTKRNVKANALVSQAIELERNDATQAIRMAQLALSKSPLNKAIQQILARIYAENEFYQHTITADTAIRQIAIAPDGKRFAAIDAEGKWLSWDVQGQLLGRITAHQGGGSTLDFSPDGRYILSAGEDKQAILWTVEGEQKQVFTGHRSAIHSIAFSGDSKQIITGSRDGEIRHWDLDGNLLKTISAHEGAVYALTFAPDNQYFASGGFDSQIILWDTTGQQIQQFTGHEDRVLALSFSNDGQFLLSGSRDKTAILWSRQGQKLKTFTGHDSRINAVNFGLNDQSVFTASDDRKILEWSLNGHKLRQYQGHHAYINSFSISPDKKMMISGGEDGLIRIWQLNNKFHQTVRHSAEGIGAAAISPEGLWLATAGYRVYAFPEEELFDTGDKSQDIKIWNSEGELIQTLSGHRDGIMSLDFSADGKLLLSGAKDATVKLWEVGQNGTAREKFNFQAHRGEVSAVQFSPSGEQLLTAGADSTIRIWNSEGREMLSLEGHEGWVLAAAFAPNGKLILSGGMDGKAILWNTDKKPAQIITLSHHKAPVVAIAFAPNGKTLLTGGEDNLACLWDRNGNLMMCKSLAEENITGFGAIRSVDFSPDGKHFVVAGTNGHISVFDLKGNLQQQLKAHSAGITTVRISPDSKFILSAGDNGFAKLIYPVKDFLNTTLIAH